MIIEIKEIISHPGDVINYFDAEYYMCVEDNRHVKPCESCEIPRDLCAKDMKNVICERGITWKKIRDDVAKKIISSGC